MTDRIVVLVVSPNSEPEVKEIDNSSDELQNIVGEDIVYITPFKDAIGIVCNYEAGDMNLPASRALVDEDGKTVDILNGTIVIVGLDEEDNFISLSQELREKYYTKFLDYRIQLPKYRNIGV